MITTIVLVDCAIDSIPTVADTIANLDGVSEVYSVAGKVDLIVVVSVRALEMIADIITCQISRIPGVLNTETHLAFRVHSKRDMEGAFSIGFECSAGNNGSRDD